MHGLSEAAVQGGASGAIVVEGIENVQPAIAGLPQRLFVVRDQVLAGVAEDDPNAPAWDLSLNYVPIEYPKMTPAVIRAPAGQREFWRVLNAAADAILDVEVLYDDAPQTLGVVAIDGVPVGSQNGGPASPPIGVTHFRMPPASRVEFLVTTPGASVRAAVLRTRAVNTGPDGDADPQRVIAKIVAGGAETAAMAVKSLEPTAMQSRQRFQALAETQPAAARRLYFSEDDDSFFITVDGQTPQAFSSDAPPAITTTQGTTEDWIIENRTKENHEFHIHQIHFLVLEQTNFEVNGSEAAKILQGQMADMIDIPFWDGNPAHPYPAVKLRMDFRGPDIGDFVYHCHILEHEDGGMMATVRVESGKSGNGTKPAVQHR